MILFQKVKFDFQAEDKAFAQQLYSRWEKFYEVSFAGVVESVLSAYDRPAEVMEIDRLEVDLGNMEEKDFYREFPKRLKEKFGRTLRNCLENRGRFRVEKTDYWAIKWLAFYLQKGYLCWDVPEQYRDPKLLLKVALATDQKQFAGFLQAEGCKYPVRWRLIIQATEEQLHKIVSLTSPQEAPFVQGYVQSLLYMYPRWKQAKLTESNFREVLWEVVLAYLWSPKRGAFGRKQFVKWTIGKLALHYGVSYRYLLGLLVKEAGQLWAEKTGEKGMYKLLTELIEEEKETEGTAEEWRERLKEPEWCRALLCPLPEEAIYRIVGKVIPAEKEKVVLYAIQLERGKALGMLQGKAGNEFRIVKWEFLFTVLLNGRTLQVNLKNWVGETLKRIAAHYGIAYTDLLEFFVCNSLEIPVWLHRTLEEIYLKEIKERPLQWVQSWKRKSDLSVEAQQYLRWILVHPFSCRHLLACLPEEEIYQLTRQVLLSESGFVILYAQELEQQKTQGAFEGKAGKEFRNLKWEFIFQVVLSNKSDQAYWVKDVLKNLAAHYGIEYEKLLEYFSVHLVLRRVPESRGLEKILTCLKNQIRQKPSEITENHIKHEAQLFDLEGILQTGFGDITTGKQIFEYMSQHQPAKIEEMLKRWGGQGKYPLIGGSSLSCLYAQVILWLIRQKQELLPEGKICIFRLEEVASGKRICKLPALYELLIALVKGEKVREQITRWMDRVCEEERLSDGCWEKAGEKPEVHTKQEEKKMLEVRDKKSGKKTVCTWENVFQECPPERLKQEFARCLERKPQELWRIRQTSRMWEIQLVKWLKENPFLCKIWVGKTGTSALRGALEACEQVRKRLPFVIDEALWWEYWESRTGSAYANYSRKELLQDWWKWVKKYRKPTWQLKSWGQGIEKDADQIPDFIEILKEEKITESRETDRWYHVLEPSMPVYVENAGLVLLSPWIPALFDRKGLLKEKKEFKDEAARCKALKLLDGLVYKTEMEESRLALNKVLVGWDWEQPVDRWRPLEEEDRLLLDGMLAAVIQYWDKLQHTSVEGFRNSFLQREGSLEEKEEGWELTVEERGYDILLDSLPWGYQWIKYPWMEKALQVKWR